MNLEKRGRKESEKGKFLLLLLRFLRKLNFRGATMEEEEKRRERGIPRKGGDPPIAAPEEEEENQAILLLCCVSFPPAKSRGVGVGGAIHIHPKIAKTRPADSFASFAR